MSISREGLSFPRDCSKRCSKAPGTYERDLIVAALEGAKGNRSEATRRLDISRATLHDKLRKVRARRRGRGRRLSLTAHG
ncbi:hypothetical protein D7X12_02385 [Corallococcus sicarius]|uniref:DNA binding HTH domain-containing protein n=1 Tax=Corallococcus sicarius TaxID=2316726 RepID=A0A3A8NVT9_9BACT|nr:hypothetical protein D7X12_02385 [Corallococcus sicarius]